MTTLNKSGAKTQLETLISGLTLASETTNNLVLILKSAELANADSSSIKTELLSRIAAVDNTTSIEELVILSAALPLITDNREISVANLTELNALSVEPGTVVFVDSENVSYVYKSNSTWEMIFASLQGAKANKNIYGWGNNTYGKIGDGSTTQRTSPVSLANDSTDWITASAGIRHSAAIQANGTAWAWGRNNYGQLGDGTNVNKSSPVSIIGGFTDWVQIDSAFDFSVGLRANGTAWAWGRNSGGYLGNNTTTSSSSPVSVVGISDWVQIETGFSHTIGLRANGTAWGWGNNGNGRLGDNTNVAKSSPVAVVGGFTDWFQVSAGGAHSLGLRTNGTAWAWGQNFSGQLGDNSTTSRLSPVSVVGGFTDWIQVSAGANHSLGLRANGTAWGWGSESYGSIGNGSYLSINTSPVSVIGGFTDWIRLNAGGTSSSGIRANGTAWSWGRNDAGQLGDGTTINKSSPVSIIGGFTDWIEVDVAPGSNVAHMLGIRAG